MCWKVERGSGTCDMKTKFCAAIEVYNTLNIKLSTVNYHRENGKINHVPAIWLASTPLTTL